MKVRTRVLWTLPLLSGMLAGGGCGRASHPEDSVLAQHFREHREQFQSLIKMFDEDASLYKIAWDFTLLADDRSWPRPTDRLGVSEQRWREYRRLFRALGLSGGISRPSPDSAMIVLVSSEIGTLSDGSEKGYAYSCEPLSPTTERLPSRPYNMVPGLAQFVPLDGCWYLYALRRA